MIRENAIYNSGTLFSINSQKFSASSILIQRAASHALMKMWEK